jgi:hypothetical protein
MMQMRTVMRHALDDEDLARRARVIVYRMRQGEMVTIPSWDPVATVVMDLIEAPVPHASAEGARPIDW